MNESQIAEAMVAGLLATYEPAQAMDKIAHLSEEFSTMADCLDTANLNNDSVDKAQAEFLRTLAAQIDRVAMEGAGH